MQVEAAGKSKSFSEKTRRLIEEWLPIAMLGIESLRERTPMTPFPGADRLHVWWRCPLVASRAAVLASLLPADADHKKFLHALGIHGDPVASRARIDEAKRSGQRFDGQAYSYSRAFSYNPTDADRVYLRTLGGGGGVPRVLDSSAGGGSIPFEAMRLGCDTYGNDLICGLADPQGHGRVSRGFGPLLKRYKDLAAKFVVRCVWSDWNSSFHLSTKRTASRRIGSGPAPSAAPTATGSCRCRRTGS